MKDKVKLEEALIEKLREKFENHFGNDAERLERNTDGDYVHPAIQFCWVDGWLACAKHLEESVKDAARYRQLRRGQKFSIINGIGDVLRAEELDAAVDAAIAATTGENDAK